MVTEIFVEETFVESTFMIKIDTLYTICINIHFILLGVLVLFLSIFPFEHMIENDENV